MQYWDSVDLLQGCPKMSSRGLSAPGAKKVKTESEKESKSIAFSTVLTLPFQLFDSFSTLFSTLWARPPGTRFRTLFPTSGPGGPKKAL